MAKRPLLITIVGVLYFIVGLISLFTAIGGYFVDSTAVSTTDLAVGAIMGLISIIVAFGLLEGVKLFWYIGVIFAVIYLIMEVASMIMSGMDGDMTLVVASVIPAIIYLVVLWYLFRSNVKEFFSI